MKLIQAAISMVAILNASAAPSAPTRDAVDVENARLTHDICEFLSKPSKAFETPPFNGSKIFDGEDPSVIWTKQKISDVEVGLIIDASTLKKYRYNNKECVGYGVHLWLPAKSFKAKELVDAINVAYKERKGEATSDSYTVLTATLSKNNDTIVVDVWVGTQSDDETRKFWPKLSKANAATLLLNSAIASTQFFVHHKSLSIANKGEQVMDVNRP